MDILFDFVLFAVGYIVGRLVDIYDSKNHDDNHPGGGACA